MNEGCIPVQRALPSSGACTGLISLDFDGTLWRAEDAPPIPSHFFVLVRQWHEQGIRWGINTGRSLSYLCQDYLPIAPFMPDFICTCERYVYLADDAGKLFAHEGHNTAAREAAAKLQVRMQPLLHAEMQRIAYELPHLKWIVAPTDPLSIEAADAPTMDIIAHLLQPFMAQHLEVSMQRAGRYMRLSDGRFHKGSALAHVVEAWQVPHHRLLLVGDGHNDVDAFGRFPEAWCAAPADAHPDVLQYIRRTGGYISSQSGVMDILHSWNESQAF